MIVEFAAIPGGLHEPGLTHEMDERWADYADRTRAGWTRMLDENRRRAQVSSKGIRLRSILEQPELGVERRRGPRGRLPVRPPRAHAVTRHDDRVGVLTRGLASTARATPASSEALGDVAV